MRLGGQLQVGGMYNGVVAPWRNGQRETWDRSLVENRGIREEQRPSPRAWIEEGRLKMQVELLNGAKGRVQSQAAMLDSLEERIGELGVGRRTEQ